MADAGRSGPLSGPGSIAAVRRIQSERQREQRQNQSDDEDESAENTGHSKSKGQADSSVTDEMGALEGPPATALDVLDDPSIATEEALPGEPLPGKKGQFIDERC